MNGVTQHVVSFLTGFSSLAQCFPGLCMLYHISECHPLVLTNNISLCAMYLSLSGDGYLNYFHSGC